MTSACPNCQTRFQIEHSFCPNCGFDLRVNSLQKTGSGTHSERPSPRSLFLTTGLKLIKLLTVLIFLTVIYSLFIEESPPKIITYFVSTLVVSSTIGALIVIIVARIKGQGNSLMMSPYQLVMTSVIIIGLAKIFAAFSGNLSAHNEYDQQSTLQVPLEKYSSVDTGVSFNYPSNWIPQTPQSAATLILLYETNGSLATCNLSAVAQDQKKIENYDTDYFKKHLPKVYKVINNIQSNQTVINGLKVSLTKYDFLLPSPKGDISAQSITLTALHGGKRFMLIINVPKENSVFIKDEIGLIIDSFTVDQSEIILEKHKQLRIELKNAGATEEEIQNIIAEEKIKDRDKSK